MLEDRLENVSAPYRRLEPDARTVWAPFIFPLADAGLKEDTTFVGPFPPAAAPGPPDPAPPKNPLEAALARIDEVTRGEGRIITSSQTQFVQNLEGGIVSGILVREGDLVQKDQVLFRIDPTRFVSEFQGNQQELLALNTKIARLSAESQGTRFSMPGEIRKLAPVLTENEATLHQARQLDLANKIGILREQMAQRLQELVELRGRAERLNEGFGFLQKEIAMTAPLVKEGVVSEVELLRLERESARLRTELDGAKLAIPRVQAAISEAQRKMQDVELAFRSQAGAELSEAKAKLAKLEEGVLTLRDRVSRAEVRSPVKGIVKIGFCILAGQFPRSVVYLLKLGLQLVIFLVQFL